MKNIFHFIANLYVKYYNFIGENNCNISKNKRAKPPNKCNTVVNDQVMCWLIFILTIYYRNRVRFGFIILI